jgi:hypothetical protein
MHENRQQMEIIFSYENTLFLVLPYYKEICINNLWIFFLQFLENSGIGPFI